jgi:hypothetical protein
VIDLIASQITGGASLVCDRIAVAIRPGGRGSKRCDREGRHGKQHRWQTKAEL